MSILTRIALQEDDAAVPSSLKSPFLDLPTSLGFIAAADLGRITLGPKL